MKKILILLFSMMISMMIFIFPFGVYAQDDIIPGAVSGVLIEANSGKIIFEKEKDKQVAIASMTKMVAQILILEQVENGNIRWDDVVTVSKNAQDMGGSQIYIQQGEKITVEDLMKGISMASGNDATVQMAEVVAGSEEKFVQMMNKKAKELGLKNTNFKNCTGLDEEGHYSSAYDMAIIARDLVVNHPEILRFSSMYEDYLRENTENKFWLVNTNKLVRFYEGADGLKTGHTDAAGYCLAATAKRKGFRLIGIVLGEDSGKVRNTETMNLLDYGFNNLTVNILKKRGEVIKKIKLDKANASEIDVVLGEDLAVLETVGGGKHKYTYDILIDEIKLPIKKESTVGRVNVLENGTVVSSSKLVVNNSVDKLTFLELFLNSLVDLCGGKV